MTSTLTWSEGDLLDVLSVLDQQDDSALLSQSPSPSPPDASLQFHVPFFVSPAELAENPRVAACATPPDAGQPRAPTMPPRRRRRKHDLQETRAAVAALEQQLALLRRSQQAPSELAQFWRRVAERLRRDRELAVADNARLRALLTEQSRVLKAAQRAINKAAEIGRNSKRDGEDRDQAASTLVTPLMQYDELLREITASFPRLDGVIQRAGLGVDIGSVSSDYKRHVSARLESNGSRQPYVCIEIAEARIVPFGVSQIDANVWGYMLSVDQNPDSMDPQLKRAWKTNGDEALGKCRVKATIGLFELGGHVAVRRYQPENRLAFVATAHCVCTHTVDPAESLSLRDTGWFLLEPLPSDPQNRTIVRSFVQYQPASPHDRAATSDLGTLMPIALKVYDTTIAPIVDGVLTQLQLAS
ncbi:hypothetical protein P43SY_009985 [Pythium insidiosum]|uniref:START domain-containing protein n=1 Tax=Pythium insidiosum TaxID=114742 RepID=A0AAD5LE94_PYTIN|nr:hypothetical protein P43SY_009985 [Pythium insidiosum]